MTTIIDRLVVELGFDTSRLPEDQKRAVDQLRGLEEASDRAGRRVSQTGTSVSQAFRGLEHPIQALRGHLERLADASHAPRQALQAVGSQARRTGLEVEDAGKAGAAGFRVLGVAGLAALGTLKAIQGALTSAAASAQHVFGVGIEAAGAGMTTKEFSAVGNALFKSGNVPVADTQGWLVRWRQAQLQAQLGHPEEAVALQQALAIGGVDANVFTDTPEAGLEAVARQLHGLSPDRRRAVGETLGMSPAMAQAAGAAGPDLPRLIAEARRNALNGGDKDVADRMLEAQNDLTAALDRLYTTIHDDLAPPLIAFEKFLTGEVNDLNAILDPNATHQQKMDAYADIPGTTEWIRRHLPSWLGGTSAPSTPPGKGAPGQLPAGLDLTTDDVEIMRRESKGNPLVGYGGMPGSPDYSPGGTDLSKVPLDSTGFPMWAGKMGPAGLSTAAGLFQITRTTWHAAAARMSPPPTDFSPETQLRVRREIQRERLAAGQAANVDWAASGDVPPVGPVVAHHDAAPPAAPPASRVAARTDKMMRAWRRMVEGETTGGVTVALPGGRVVKMSPADYDQWIDSGRTALPTGVVRDARASHHTTTTTTNNRNTDVHAMHVHVHAPPGASPYQLGRDVGSAAANSIRAAQVNSGQN